MDLEELNQTKEYEKPKEGDDCPNCEGQLVERYRRDFESIDKKPFLGCSEFPKCKFTQSL